MKVNLNSVQRVFEREYPERSRLMVEGFEDKHVLAVVGRQIADEVPLESLKQGNIPHHVYLSPADPAKAETIIRETHESYDIAPAHQTTEGQFRHILFESVYFLGSIPETALHGHPSLLLEGC